MNLVPVDYKPFTRNPIGCFEANMTDSGWGGTKYVNTTDSVLFTSEISEFSRMIYQFFKQYPDWTKLSRFAAKFGTEIRGESYETVRAMNFVGDQMDYEMQITGTVLKIYPYRKQNDKLCGRFEK